MNDEKKPSCVTPEGLADDVSKMWLHAVANDTQVATVLTDPRFDQLPREKVAEMFFGLGAFAMLRVTLGIEGQAGSDQVEAE